MNENFPVNETVGIDPVSSMRAIHARILTRENVVSPVSPSARTDTESQLTLLKRLEAQIHHQYQAFGRNIIVRNRGLLGKVESFVMRGLRWLLHSYARPQVEFNQSVTLAISACLKILENSSRELDRRQREKSNDLGNDPCVSDASIGSGRRCG